MDQRAVAQILCGFATNGYLLLDPVTSKVVKSCDVTCIEDKNYHNLGKESVEIEQPENGMQQLSNNIEKPSEKAEDNLEKSCRWDHDYARALVGCKILKKYQEERLSDNIPQSFQDAEKSKFRDQWIAAMNEEFDWHDYNQTWKVADRIPGANIIKTRWVCRVKYGGNGKEIAKARLVARGDVDRNQYGLEQTYSNVITPITIRWVLLVIHTPKLYNRQLRF